MEEETERSFQCRREIERRSSAFKSLRLDVPEDAGCRLCELLLEHFEGRFHQSILVLAMSCVQSEIKCLSFLQK